MSLLNLNIYNTSTISEDNDSNVFIQNYVNINPLEGQDYYESNDSYDDAVHVHKYITHVWLNNTQHESFCNCGDSIICGHSKFTQDINCALCGGRADIGFIGPFN